MRFLQTNIYEKKNPRHLILTRRHLAWTNWNITTLHVCEIVAMQSYASGKGWKSDFVGLPPMRHETAKLDIESKRIR